MQGQYVSDSKHLEICNLPAILLPSRHPPPCYRLGAPFSAHKPPPSLLLVLNPDLRLNLLFTFPIENLNQSRVAHEPAGKFSGSAQDVKGCLWDFAQSRHTFVLCLLLRIDSSHTQALCGARACRPRLTLSTTHLAPRRYRVKVLSWVPTHGGAVFCTLPTQLLLLRPVVCTFRSQTKLGTQVSPGRKHVRAGELEEDSSILHLLQAQCAKTMQKIQSINCWKCKEAGQGLVP